VVLEDDADMWASVRRAAPSLLPLFALLRPVERADLWRACSPATPCVLAPDAALSAPLAPRGRRRTRRKAPHTPLRLLPAGHAAEPAEPWQAPLARHVRTSPPAARPARLTAGAGARAGGTWWCTRAAAGTSTPTRAACGRSTSGSRPATAQAWSWASRPTAGPATTSPSRRASSPPRRAHRLHLASPASTAPPCPRTRAPGLRRGQGPQMCQWVFGARAGHAVLARTLDLIVARFVLDRRAARRRPFQPDVMQTTGPWVFTMALEVRRARCYQ